MACMFRQWGMIFLSRMLSDAFGYNSAMTSCRADSWATGVMMLRSMKLLKIEMQVVSWLHGPGENVPK